MGDEKIISSAIKFKCDHHDHLPNLIFSQKLCKLMPFREQNSPGFIEGGKKTFSNAKALIIKMSIEELYHGQKLFEDIYLQLRELGFRYRSNYEQSSRNSDGQILQSMINKINLGIVTDDPPVSDKVIASGMCRVNTRLFQALAENINLIAINNLDNHYRFKDISQELQNKCVIITIPELPRKIIKRFYPQLSYDTIFQLKLPNLVRKFKQNNTNWIFCPCGVNPLALGRGFNLAKASGLPLAVYLVDDFLSGAILSGNEEHLIVAKRDVAKWLSQVNQIFVISEGLRRRIQELYNLDSVVLPLPYKIPQYSNQDLLERKEEQIIFVGNLAHFYLDGLRQIAAILDDLNRENETYITLRLTLPNLSQVKSLIGDFDCIRCSNCSTSQLLHQEIASSLLCFAPYSFQPKYKEMVSTSFPSKMLDYLAFAKLIVTYAPEYASSVLYFQEHGLSNVLSTEDPDELRKLILRQLHEKQNYNLKYREVINKYHSSEYIAELIISCLNS